MSARSMNSILGLIAALGMAVLLPSAGALAAKDPPPQVSPEGLQLTKSTKNRLVYVKPGATFAQYKRLAILDPLVEFEKDWQKDYNRSRTGLEGRVSDADVSGSPPSSRRSSLTRCRTRAATRSWTRRPRTYWCCARRCSTSRSTRRTS